MRLCTYHLQWACASNRSRELSQSYGTCQKNDANVQNVFPKLLPRIIRFLLKSAGSVHTNFWNAVQLRLRIFRSCVCVFQAEFVARTAMERFPQTHVILKDAYRTYIYQLVQTIYSTDKVIQKRLWVSHMRMIMLTRTVNAILTMLTW